MPRIYKPIGAGENKSKSPALETKETKPTQEDSKRKNSGEK